MPVIKLKLNTDKSLTNNFLNIKGIQFFLNKSEIRYQNMIMYSV